MIQLFDLRHLNRSPAALNPEKLLWLNQHYIREGSNAGLGHILTQQLQSRGVVVTACPSIEEVVAVQKERAKTMAEMAEKSRCFYEQEWLIDQVEAHKVFNKEIRPAFEYMMQQFEALTEWHPASIHNVIAQASEQSQQKLGKIAQPLRLAVTGATVSPSIDVTLYLLGRDKVVSRIQHVIINYLC